ncbi:L-glutaminase [Caminicella sporogenes DSM 14501]|uniref:Glutaminase n=1 Tax=Caminicella sporogenes DSM 14501 TaxID=1121266 RepID=A0A1M6MVE0_9FIRM|nr:glutaminase A [Caminicella sporogenes]RKD22484.1 glutaminase A [Caminicella sporogenes]WIF94983.1 glutaminase A [Caminicella sporogenes]SHJ87417.1 L-glutaminase [Caminicella sporogenes DSM 14501]
MQSLLKELVEENRHWVKHGKVANYIPELGKMDPNKLGIVVVDTGGKVYRAGDYDISFTAQSMSKPLVLLLALMDNGEEIVFSKVGKEPTGDPFNSIRKLETLKPPKPLNPMINAGAIAVTSLIKGKDNEEKFERILNLFRKISKNPNLDINKDVYLSEKRTGDRNRAIAYFLKDVNIIEGDAEEILDLYFKQCSIEVTCEDIANIGMFLANQGMDMELGETLIPKYYTQIVKTFMVTCGMYDASGEFAINVGIPAKSGVSGGIMCAVPNRMGIGVIGPALDSKGNSIAGVKVLEGLSKKLMLSIF